jgi:hypothetical protein
MALKTLYHGTDVDSAKYICQKIDVKLGAKNTDFGQGFYLTNDYNRAIRWAYRKSGLRCKKAAVVTAIFDEKEAEHVIEYFNDELRWGRFVINNRNGIEYISNVPFQDNNLDSRYQITCGRIADIEVVSIADELKQSGQMLMSIEGILNKGYPIQYAFHTDKAVEYIKKVSYRIV